MTISQQERVEILQDVARAWLDLLKTIRPLSDQELVQSKTVGEWSIKDTMAHVSAWEREGIKALHRVEEGQPPNMPDEDAFNREQIMADADRELVEIRVDFERTHDELMALLEVTPALSRELVDGITYEHYREHAAAIKGATGDRAIQVRRNGVSLRSQMPRSRQSTRGNRTYHWRRC